MSRVEFTYFNGRTKTMERRFANTLEKLKKGFVSSDQYQTKVIETSPVIKNELAFARQEYQDKMGKKPFHGWSVEELKEKMTEGS